MTRAHGTYVKYVQDRCRCDDCRAATRDYERHRKARRIPPYVGAARAREHLRWLSEHGVGMKTVARVSGVAHGTLTKLIYGDGARGMAPSRRIRRETEWAILAVSLADAAPGCRIPAGPTWAHIETLLDRGWTRAAIGRRVHGPDAVTLQLARTTVTAANAAKVRALLDEPVPPRRSRWGDAPAMTPSAEEAEPEVPGHQWVGLPQARRYTGDLAWTTQAACRHADIPTGLFYPARGDLETVAAAKAICARCPHTTACLDYALALGDEHGIWGGTTGRERRRLRRERRREGAA